MTTDPNFRNKAKGKSRFPSPVERFADYYVNISGVLEMVFLKLIFPINLRRLSRLLKQNFGYQL